MLLNALNRLTVLSRWQKRTIQILADVVLLAASFVLAMNLRLDDWSFMADRSLWFSALTVIAISLVFFVRLGFYRAVIRYMGNQAMTTIIAGISASVLALYAVDLVFSLPIPRSVPLIYGLLAFLSVGGIRFAFRSLYQRSQARQRTPVLIIGAGEAGRQVALSLAHGRDYTPKALVDPEARMVGAEIGGLSVHSLKAVPRLIDIYGIELVLLALPQVGHQTRLEVVELLETLPVEVKTVPNLRDVIVGEAEVSQLRAVNIEEILGRDPVEPEPALMGAQITGKTVMVTGAGGSIGSELCRQVVRQRPARLVLFDCSEFALYQIDMELRTLMADEGLSTPVAPVLGSVLDRRRLDQVIATFGVQTIYHAAAYKHVPLVENNIVEGLRNNVFGTRAVADAAVAGGVEAFILISTDKAVRPTNVMGASKRLAELICQARAGQPGGPVFTMVRFGNVLGSSGSVVPLFRDQIDRGGPITVTDRDITRYFMTIPEAAQLVIQAGSMARGGEVYVLDMGEAVKIVDMAFRMARLSGLTPVLQEGDDAPPLPKGQIGVRITGLRPGEKLYEELLATEESQGTRHPRIREAREEALSRSELDSLLATLEDSCSAYDLDAVRMVLLAAPAAYAPTGGIVDLMWGGVGGPSAAAPVSLGIAANQPTPDPAGPLRA